MKKSRFSISVIGRLKTALRLRTDVELAKHLGVRQNTVSGWKSRDTLDYKKIIEICDGNNISFDWLFSGKGSMFAKSEAVYPPLPHQEAVYDEERDVLIAPAVTISGNTLSPIGTVEEFPGFLLKTLPLARIHAFVVPEGWLLTLPKIGPGDRLLLNMYEPPATLSTLYREGNLYGGYALVSRGQVLRLKLLEEVGPNRIALLNLPGESDAYALNLDEDDDCFVYATVLWIASIRVE